MEIKSPSHGLLEREGELVQIDEALAGASSGRGRALLIRGDAGIGKTTLISVAASRARDRGITVLGARADRLETELSFGVCGQLFRHMVSAEEVDAGGVFDGAAALALPALEDGDVIPGAPGEDRTLPLINGLYWLCANLSEQAPLLITVDDAHWADLPSLRFLRFLLRRLDGMAISIALATRPVRVPGHSGGLLVELAGEPGVVLTEPDVLSGSASARLIEGQLGVPDPEFAEACSRLSGGNPLYMTELVRSAASRGLKPTRERSGELLDLHPDLISESVAARLEVPGESGPRLAAVAAVGGELHLRDAATLAGLTPIDARKAADALAAGAILASSEPLSFCHPLVEATVYDAIPEAERGELHLRVAELLRDTGAGSEAITVHLLNAERRSASWALEELESAGRAAMSRGSPAAAATYLRRALEEEPTGERRGAVLVALGLAETEAGDHSGVERLAAAVELLPEPEARAGVLLGLGMTLTAQGEVGRATAAYERGIAALVPVDTRVARNLEALCAVGLIHDREARTEALPRIEALLDQPDLDDSPIGRLLLAQAAAECAYQCGSIASLKALAARALAPGLDEGDPTAFWTYVLSAYAYDDCDDYDGAERAIESALGLARRRGSAVQDSAARHPRSFVNLRRGLIAAALGDAQASIEGAEHGWRIALPSSRAVLAEAHLELGELELADAAVQLPGGDEPWERLISFAWLLAARGRVRLEQAEPADALAVLLECGERCVAAQLDNPSVIAWRSVGALAAARLDRPDQARRLVEAELALAREFGAPRAIGAAQRTLGLILGEGDGIEPLREAVATLQSTGARLEYVRSLVDLGSALRRSGQRRDARGPLRRGLDLARRCGCIALADRALLELQAAGSRPRRLELTGVDSLTPSERRVTEMAVEGLSNPQIAQALFVTRRTVEMHLTNAYRKLEIHSRDELTTALASDRAG